MSATTSSTHASTGPALRAPLDPDLTALLRRLKLGKAVDTLPERLALAAAKPAEPHRVPHPGAGR